MGRDISAATRQCEAVLLGLLELIRLLLSDIRTSTEGDLSGWERKRHEKKGKIKILWGVGMFRLGNKGGVFKLELRSYIPQHLKLRQMTPLLYYVMQPSLFLPLDPVRLSIHPPPLPPIGCSLLARFTEHFSAASTPIPLAT